MDTCLTKSQANKGEAVNTKEDKPLTKRAFLEILERVVTTPIPSHRRSRKKPAPAESGTSEPHRPDGCTGTHTHPSMTEDAGVRRDD